MGGAIRLGGDATIYDCSFISNKASSSGLAVSVIGSVDIKGSSFDGNVFSCDEGEFMEYILHVSKPSAGYMFFRMLF